MDLTGCTISGAWYTDRKTGFISGQHPIPPSVALNHVSLMIDILTLLPTGGGGGTEAFGPDDQIIDCNSKPALSGTSKLSDLVLSIMSQSIPTGYIPPVQPPGLAQKTCPGGRDLTFESCPGPGILQGSDFVENESETSKI